MPDTLNSVMPTDATRHEGIDRKCYYFAACEMKDEEHEEEMNISRKSLNVSWLESNDQITNEINNVRSGGSSSLDSSTKEFMDSRFDYDFSNVRIYSDERAADIC